MSPGRELDALVAEKVMGQVVKWLKTALSDREPHVGATNLRCPPYSTDVAGMWWVVERMNRRFHLRLISPFAPGEPYFAGFTPHNTTGWNGRPDYEASADTAPLAICLAALKAVGVSPSQEAGKP